MQKLMISLLVVPVSAALAFASEPAPLEVADLEVVVGADWTGSLTYLNYQEPFIDFTIPAALKVTANTAVNSRLIKTYSTCCWSTG